MVASYLLLIFFLELSFSSSHSWSYILITGTFTGVKSDSQHPEIGSEDDCKALCQKKRGCWGFSYKSSCNLFNATADDVMVKRGDSGDVIWLMVNYNLTTCASFEDIQMGLSYDPQTSACNVFDASVDNVVVERDHSGDYIWLMLNYNLTSCGTYTGVSSVSQHPEIGSLSGCKTLCEGIAGCWGFSYKSSCNLFNATSDNVVVNRGDTGDVVWLMVNYNLSTCGSIDDIQMGFSYNTICNLFNATSDAVVVKREHPGDVIWLMLNYNLTKCGTLDDIQMLWSDPYCVNFTCGVVEPMLQWKIEVQGSTYSSVTAVNETVSCGGLCFFPSTACLEGYSSHVDDSKTLTQHQVAALGMDHLNSSSYVVSTPGP
ncbi:unnamed protein product [Caenorhabditis auriculariae]|uniref:Apple domain-containing protein n=1 Tax=Caenorhabditis auriculariae TaxID=2777116 RepID=A0A8S1HMU6_9PELO|nr:unnamed protein product [Caenorhabditis auriculariae]